MESPFLRERSKAGAGSQVQHHGQLPGMLSPLPSSRASLGPTARDT